MDVSRFSVIGVNISEVDMDSAKDYLYENFQDAKNNYICVTNVHTTVKAHEDDDYLAVQNNSFLTLPDGKPLSIIGKKKGYKVERVTGPDFMESIFTDERFSNCNHFFYGNKKEHLCQFVEYIRNKYPMVNICGYEPSVFRELSENERSILQGRIRESNADFVWVALGAPKQEAFCKKMCNDTNAVWIGVGGAFNVISGVIPRAPKWMQDSSLEWLYRLMKEPKRLFKRYFITNTKFIFYLFASKFKQND